MRLQMPLIRKILLPAGSESSFTKHTNESASISNSVRSVNELRCERADRLAGWLAGSSPPRNLICVNLISISYCKFPNTCIEWRHTNARYYTTFYANLLTMSRVYLPYLRLRAEIQFLNLWLPPNPSQP